MYLFEIQDILFAIKSIKTPSSHFDITNYIVFSSANTRSGASNKLLLPHHQNNISRHSYFHRLPLLWNAMPIFDMSMSFYLSSEHNLTPNQLFIRGAIQQNMLPSTPQMLHSSGNSSDQQQLDIGRGSSRA